MTVTVKHEEHSGHLIISANGLYLHLESSLETKDEIWLLVGPEERTWDTLAQADENDPQGIKLVFRRI